MPISPQDVDDYVKDKFKLNELYLHLDEHLKRNGVVASSMIHTRWLPDYIAELVIKPYTNLGWKVTYKTHSSQRDGDFTTFTFIR